MSTRKATDPCLFDKLFIKHVPHIFEKIVLSLDYKSLNVCLYVSRIWRGALTTESFQKKVVHVFRKEKLETCAIATHKLRMLEFSAFVEQKREVNESFKHHFVHIGGPVSYADPVLEVGAIDLGGRLREYTQCDQ